MLLPASQIAIAEPLCPSCGGEVGENHAACGYCGYGFEFATQLLPYEAPPLRKFIDFDGCLTREDIRLGQRAVERLRIQFPQITLCTCLATVPSEVSLSEFGFWFFNQSVPNSPRLTERRLHSILFCIDPDRGEASLTVGYGLDPFIADQSLSACLAKIHKPLAARDYGKAISKLCRALRPILSEGADEASRAYSEAMFERRHLQQREQLPPRRTPTQTPQPAPHETNV